MDIKFKKDTPYTARKNSKKFWRAGYTYTVDNELGKQLVESGVARDVTEEQRKAFEALMKAKKKQEAQN